MFEIYRLCLRLGAPFLHTLLDKRTRKGKEDPERLQERKGKPGKPRPPGPLVWVHAASVGEAQSTLILIDNILKLKNNINVLVTTGTVTSARMMSQKLPARAFHQFYPVDHPDWVKGFLDHWRPELVLWMESEIWPCMLQEIKKRDIPAALINARLSAKSARLWKLLPGPARQLLSAFSSILAQTQEDAAHYAALGAKHIHVTDNLKYSAKPLPVDETDFKNLQGYLRDRPVWVYASSHKGEEALACRVHQILQAAIPELMTIIIPRHIQRGAEIRSICQSYSLKAAQREAEKFLPVDDTDIYIADTMGELGLFYRLAPVACIGRSFSDDGGGGHNPIEAAQLNCAVLHGPNVQYQKQIFREMDEAGAALEVRDEKELTDYLRRMLTDRAYLEQQQRAAFAFAKDKEVVIERVIKALTPLLQKLENPAPLQKAKSA
jgi:3-deoxy-D-manno-octulosonic-acid transferase